jgi:soluble lytic murein transglycosylase-like protein
MSIYDDLFKKYSFIYFGYNFDWRWLKAQCRAESNFNPQALSPSGAMGLMQLMPGTAKDMATFLQIKDDPWDIEANIAMGIMYDKKCWNVWKKETGVERIRFMLSSYNAGIGNILLAQKISTIKDKIGPVLSTLRQVTGKHSIETIDYVYRIENYYKEYIKQ